MENKDISNNKKSSIWKIIKFIIILIFVIIITFLYGRFVEPNFFKIKEYNIVNENFVENFYGLKILHISDIHYGNTTDKKDLDRILNKINLTKPDIVVMTGDLYSIELSDEQIEELKNFLNSIDASISKYAIKGNHDNDELWDSIIKDTDFIDLNNNYDLIYNKNNNSIFMAGINTEDEIDTNFEKIDEYLNNNADNEQIVYKILLLHKPDSITNFDYSKYDLILGGHSHNGQVNIPLIGPIYTPVGAKKYYKGYYELNNTKLYISSGIGTSLFKMRLFDMPSVNLYRLVNK